MSVTNLLMNIFDRETDNRLPIPVSSRSSKKFPSIRKQLRFMYNLLDVQH